MLRLIEAIFIVQSFAQFQEINCALNKNKIIKISKFTVNGKDFLSQFIL